MAFRNKGRGRGARSAPYESYEGGEDTAVYVGNLPWDCDWKQLKVSERRSARASAPHI